MGDDAENWRGIRSCLAHPVIWLNLNLPITVKSERFIGSEPVDRATWLCLLSHCAIHETSGLIENCADWPDRKWQQLIQVTLAEVKRECPLWEWRGVDILVWGYPIEAQDNCDRLRKLSKKAAAKRWDKKINGTVPTRKGRGNPYVNVINHPDAHSEPLIPKHSQRLKAP